MEYIYYVYILMIIAVLVFVGFYMYKSCNKESFDGAPSGYGNFLLADNDGNLNTFSLSKLQTDIQTMINNSLSNYYNKTDIDSKFNNYYTKKTIDDYNTSYKATVNGQLNNYVKYDEVITMTGMYGIKGKLIGETNNNLYMTDKKDIQPNNKNPYKQYAFVINKPPSGVSTDPNKMTGWTDETNGNKIIT